ncbi:hypothetical protein CLOM_g14010 [Closterium sp. NIES-68]|nr:hypothetical protein CLOM_g14010 [Closterium sp. NIES-68]
MQEAEASRSWVPRGALMAGRRCSMAGRRCSMAAARHPASALLFSSPASPQAHSPVCHRSCSMPICLFI